MAPLHSDLERPIQLYAWGYDEAEWDLVAEAFTEDGVLIHATDPLVREQAESSTVGRAEIVERFKGTRSDFAARGDVPRHISSNILVDHASDTEAGVRSYYLFAVQRAGELHVLGLSRYYDELVNDAGVWRIKKRRNVAAHGAAYQALVGSSA